MSERMVFFDVETTGLKSAEGDRIIEIGLIELVNRKPEKEIYYRLNPEREIDAEATQVHGITAQDLVGEKKFSEVAEELLNFIDGDTLVAHNASFDVGFLDAELALAGLNKTRGKVVDTLEMARKKRPGQRNSLDALCADYSIDTSAREKHSALVDTRLLVQVYLALTGGQGAFDLDDQKLVQQAANAEGTQAQAIRYDSPVIRADKEELVAHESLLKQLEEQAGNCLWRSFGS